MDIERRSLLRAASCLALSGFIYPLDAGIPAEADEIPGVHPNDPVNQENAALDRMINGICRGC